MSKSIGVKIREGVWSDFMKCYSPLITEEEVVEIETLTDRLTQAEKELGERFVIEKDIPCHKVPRKKRGNVWMRTIERMEIGDSFFVETDDNKELINTRSHIQLTVSVMMPRDVRVATRRVEGGLRVWRVNTKGVVG